MNAPGPPVPMIILTLFISIMQEENDRVGLLHTLATLEEHPESVPINALVAVEGTPLADEGKADTPDIWDMGRMIATARIVMPRTMVRLSAGRLSFSEAEQVNGGRDELGDVSVRDPVPFFGLCHAYGCLMYDMTGVTAKVREIERSTREEFLRREEEAEVNGWALNLI